MTQYERSREPEPESGEEPQDPQADLQLAQRACSGDRVAHATLARRLRCVPKFVRRIRGRCSGNASEHEIDDLVGDVMSAVIEGLPNYRGENVLEAWVYRITKFTVWRRVRESRRLAELESSDELVAALPAPTVTPRFEQRETLSGLLDRVGGRAADVIRLRHFEGLEFDDISYRLDLPLATTRSHYYRGLRTVRGFLASEPG